MERSDLLTFGSLRNETANRRSQNPEKRYIEQLHSCIFMEFSARRISDLTRVSHKSYITEFLKEVVYRCKSVSFDTVCNHPVTTQPITTPSNTFIGDTFRLSQSELTNILSQHELYVNTYRWVDWESRMSKLFEKSSNPYNPPITLKCLENLKSPLPF